MYGQATVEAPSASPGLATRSARWAGRVVSALVVAFLAFDGISKALTVEPVVEATTRLGYPEGSVFGIGVTLLVCTALYAVPRTAFLGAIRRLRAPAKGRGEPAYEEQGTNLARRLVQNLHAAYLLELPGTFGRRKEVRDERAPRRESGPLQVSDRREAARGEIRHTPEEGLAVFYPAGIQDETVG